jgi:hypothetical protein
VKKAHIYKKRSLGGVQCPGRSPGPSIAPLMYIMFTGTYQGTVIRSKGSLNSDDACVVIGYIFSFSSPSSQGRKFKTINWTENVYLILTFSLFRFPLSTSFNGP